MPFGRVYDPSRLDFDTAAILHGLNRLKGASVRRGIKIQSASLFRVAFLFVFLFLSVRPSVCLSVGGATGLEGPMLVRDFVFPTT